MPKLQFEIPENCTMPKVVIAGNYYGSKTMPSLNNLLAAYGTHPKQGSALKKKFERICCDEIRTQLPNYQVDKPIVVHYRYFEPRDGHIRDVTNVHAFCSKVFCDALQVCKVIPNDNPKYLVNETHDFFFLPEKWGEPYIEIFIEELNE